MEDYLGKKLLLAGFIILGVKNEHFSIDFNRGEELSFNSKR